MGGNATSLQAEKLTSSSSAPASARSSPAAVRPSHHANGSTAHHQQQTTPSKSPSKSTTHCVLLTESEKQIVKRSWRRLQKPPAAAAAVAGAGTKMKPAVDGTNGGRGRSEDDAGTDSALAAVAASRQLDELGVRIFLRIFELAPETRDAFPLFRRFTDRSALVGNVVFRCHARRFVRAVQSVVDNIDSLDVVARPNLELLGRRHRDFAGFEPRYLRAFETAMDDVWRRELGRRRYGPATRRAWRKVFELITSTVLDGYVEPDDESGGCGRLAAGSPRRSESTGVGNVNSNGDGGGGGGCCRGNGYVAMTPAVAACQAAEPLSCPRTR